MMAILLNFRFYLLVIHLLLTLQNTFGQIAITNTQTPAQLVQNVLLGAGVTVTNITYNGSLSDAQTVQDNISSFDATGTTFNFASGLLLTTGQYHGASGPNSSGSSTDAGTPSVSSDPDLGAIASAGITNGAVLEFDFTTTDNILQLRYLFGSEEYPEYAPSSFNDAFGFFLSGPGIAGSFANGAVNLAQLPGTSIPVTINNVNQSSNSVFYQNNLGGATYGNALEYDGTTVPLLASITLLCNTTYHIKLAISNVGDQGWDSGVFFEAGSFITSGFGSNFLTSFSSPAVYEDCAPVNFTIQRSASGLATPTVLNWSVLGSAASSDYSSIPISHSFAAGESTFSFPITAVTDLLTETNDSIIIRFTFVNSCGDTINLDKVLKIADGTQVNAGADVNACADEITNINASASGGVFSWSNSLSLSDSTILNPLPQNIGTTTYRLTVDNQFGCSKFDEVTVQIFPALLSTITAPSAICNGDSMTLVVTGGTTFNWQDIASQSMVGTSANIVVSPNFNNFYRAIVSDQNGCVDTLQAEVTVYATPIVTVNSAAYCSGSSALLTANGATSYLWSPANALSATNVAAITTTTTQNQTYTVQGVDTNGCKSTAQSEVIVFELPTVSASDTSYCYGDETLLTVSGASTYVWSPNIALSTNVNAVVTCSSEESITYTVVGTDSNGCINTTTSIVIVHPLPNLNAGDDQKVCDGLEVVLNAVGSGAINWSSAVNNNIAFTPDLGTTEYFATITDSNGCKKTDSLEVIVIEFPVATFSTSSNEVDMTNPSINIVNESQYFTSCTWNFGDNQISNAEAPSHTYAADFQTTYTINLSVTNELGCVDSSSKTITANELEIYYVPNSFTPDGDEYNNNFKPIFSTGIDLNTYKMLIFNRWGEEIFETNDTANGWDGTQNGSSIQDGTYIWTIEYKSKKNDKRTIAKGHVNLIR
jgi:gliding motility-associated-like protein